MNQKACSTSYIQCGKVYPNNIDRELDPSQPPILLGELTLDKGSNGSSQVFLKFSEFIQFTVVGVNPRLQVTYRLIKEREGQKYPDILQDWYFEFDATKPLEGDNVSTIQPTVLHYCDTVEGCTCKAITYKLQVIQIETHAVEHLALVNESLVASVVQKSCRCSKLPHTRCGHVCEQVLPLHLSRNEYPVRLAKVCVPNCEDANVLLNFAGFVTSVLKEEHFNDLTFRLVKYSGNQKEVLQEWPFRRAFVNDTAIKEPIIYNYCDNLKGGCTSSVVYAMELVQANLSDASYYDITDKSFIAQVYAKPYLTCGRVYEWEEIAQENRHESQQLAMVTVDTGGLCRPTVWINYSQNFTFTFEGEDPKIELVYRLVRENNATGVDHILEEWTYKASEVIPTQVAPIVTIEPLVLNYCDKIREDCDDTFTYRIELVKTVTDNTSFAILYQDMAAVVDRRIQEVIIK